MAADLRRAVYLLYQPETEWNRIVADTSAAGALRLTVGALLGASTVFVAVGYLWLRPVGTSLAFVPVYATMFAAGRLGATLLAWLYLRSRNDVTAERAALLAGFGSIPIHVEGVLEILPIPFMRWLWVLAGLGLAYMTLATAMTPVLGTSSERGAQLARSASAALALPIVALDLLRHVCP